MLVGMESIEIAELTARFKGASAEDVLRYFIETYKGRIGLASSLSIEDQAITDMICRHLGFSVGSDCHVFTLDTGRLFPETYSLIESTNDTYGIRIDVKFPDFRAVEQMVGEKGVNLFYKSVENRRECCAVRKIEPLRRAFEGLDVWICGLRRSQSMTRATDKAVQWDAANGILKINPLIEWSEEQTWDYIRAHNVPYNRLHDKGFPSIGCQPCTRAVNEGEDVRAGRWWWERPDQKECGLHSH